MKSLPNKALALLLSIIFCCDISLFNNDWYLIKWQEFMKNLKESKTTGTINRLFDKFLKLDY